MAVRWLEPEDTIDPNGPDTMACIERACWILYKLTAEKYPGILRTTDCYNLENENSVTVTPAVMNGNMYNVFGKTGVIFENNNRRLRLRHSPVLKIYSITQNGSVLPSASYQIRNNAYITKADLSPWILQTNSDLCVDYNFGSKPPLAGKYAAIRLTNEFLLAIQDPDSCALPERVRSISRQGISIDMLDPQDFITEGKTGIYEIDMFIRAANPSQSKKRPKIYSPDRPRGEKIN